MTEDKVSTVRMRESTKQLLEEEGYRGESHEEIFIRLIKEVREYRRRCG